MVIDVLDRDDLLFPGSLPEFQRLFPDEVACAAYLERARWSDGFICPHCGTPGEPYRFANRAGVLRCRHCNRDTSLTAGTVMERTHTPLSVWFWARIGGKPGELVEADETHVGGRTRGKGRGIHDMVLVAGAVEVRQRKRTSSHNKRKTGCAFRGT